MKRAPSAYLSTVALKVAMAVTGVGMFVFVFFHLYGNLKLFAGPEVINEYAEGLRHLGHPVFGDGHLLALARLSLIATVVVHFAAATALSLRSRAARPHRYAKHEHIALSYASGAMLWGGLWIAGFVLFHLLHLTFGVVGPAPTWQDSGHLDVHANMVAGFQSPALAILYILSMLPLGLHLYHGLWSATQTVGANNPAWNKFRRPIAAVIAGAVVAGYITIPAAVLVGLVA